MSRIRWKGPLALFLTLGLAASLSACGDDDDGGGATTGDDDTEVVEGSTIRIAPQDFNEAKTLTEVYGQYLEAEGFDVDIQAPNGFRPQVYPALEADSLDLIIDYTGSGARYLDPTVASSADPETAYGSLTTGLEGRGLVAFDYSPAEDKNALIALKSWADENGVTKISDLANVDGTIKLGALEDCRERTDCLAGYNDPAVYGLSLEMTALEYGPAQIAALQANEVQVIQNSTTAPDIASGDFVVLEDDKGMLSADNVVPVLRADLADEYGDTLADAINELSALITTDDLIAWNSSTDVDKEEPADVATAWLEEKGLI